MKLLKGIVKGIDKLNTFVGNIMGYFTLVIMAAIIFEVVSRRFFNSPTLWAYETICMVFGAFIVLIPGYGLLQGGMVNVDLLSSKLSLKASHIMVIITYLIMFVPFVGGIIPAAFQFAAQSWAAKEHSWSQWAPPVYPLKTCIVVGFSLLFLQGISQVLKSVVWLGENWNGPSAGKNAKEVTDQ